MAKKTQKKILIDKVSDDENSQEEPRETSDDEIVSESSEDEEQQISLVGAHDIRKGTIIVLKKNHVCKVLDYTSHKGGKHGTTKIIIHASDLFTGRRVEEAVQSDAKVISPTIHRSESRITSIDDDNMAHMQGKVLSLAHFEEKQIQIWKQKLIRGQSLQATMFMVYRKEKIDSIQVVDE